MTRINSIKTISITEQRAIQKWYTNTIYIVLVLLVTLLAITLTSIYLTSAHMKPCLPRIDQAYVQGIKQKHTILHTRLQNEKQISTIQESGKQSIERYIQLLLIHTQKPSLASVTTMQLSPNGFTATYATNSLSCIQEYMDRLRTVPVLKTVTLESFDHGRNATCTLQAQWVF